MMTSPAPVTSGTSQVRSPLSAIAARVVGGGLLVATGAIHLDLYLTGYRAIPTIGWLFLLQVVSAFGLGLAVLALGGTSGVGRLIAASGALFAVSTLGGYLLSMWVGLFGYKEIRTTAGIVAAVLEIAAFLVLGMLAAAHVPRPGLWAVLPLSAVAVIVLAVSEATATGLAAPAPQHSTTQGASASATAIHITIKNFAFRPARATAKAGEQIVVKNEDPVTHTFTATGSATGKFNSGPILPGQSRTITAPAAAGSYPFFCTIHQFMTGVLVVT
jgi:plastocyanin